MIETSSLSHKLDTLQIDLYINRQTETIELFHLFCNIFEMRTPESKATLTTRSLIPVIKKNHDYNLSTLIMHMLMIEAVDASTSHAFHISQSHFPNAHLPVIV